MGRVLVSMVDCVAFEMPNLERLRTGYECDQYRVVRGIPEDARLVSAEPFHNQYDQSEVFGVALLFDSPSWPDDNAEVPLCFQVEFKPGFITSSRLGGMPL